MRALLLCLDQTIIEPKSGHKFSEGCKDWKFSTFVFPASCVCCMRMGEPLQNIACNSEKKADGSLGVDGVSRYVVVFSSNQLTPKRHASSAKTAEAYQAEWKKKIGLIAQAVRIPTFPLHTID